MFGRKRKAIGFRFTVNRKGEPVVEVSSRQGQARVIESLNLNPVTVVVRR